MYRQSTIRRKYSSTPIVRVSIDGNGREVEEMICICTGKKDEADDLAHIIVRLLNEEIAPFMKF